MTNADMSKGVVIAFLVINKIDELPQLAIQSALDVTKNRIVIGFTKPEDIVDLPKSDRISYKKLEYGKDWITNSYTGIQDLNFFKIVQLKWTLIDLILKENVRFLIYSDCDVFWNRDPIPEIVKGFDKFPNVNMYIQSDTRAVHYLVPCMGFVAMRSNTALRDFIIECKIAHEELSLSNLRVGDDDVVKAKIEEYGQPEWIRELPQSTFPVGALLGLYKSKSSFPNVTNPAPYIFHANYTVGLRNKRLMMRMFLSGRQRRRYKLKMSGSWMAYYSLKIIKSRLNSLLK